MEAATDGAFKLQAGYQYPGNPYYVEAGKEKYNLNDRALAQRLLREGGYKGEEVVLITNQDYQTMYNAAVVMAEQMKGFGMNVKVEVSDWPTQRKKREDPKAWQHLLHGLWHRALSGRGVGHPGPRAADGSPDVEGRRGPHPALRGPRQQAHVRGAEGRLREAQERIYDQVHAIKFGDLTKVQAARANVKGFKPYRIPRMWNVWLRSRDGAPRPVAHRPRGGGTIRAPALTYRRRRVIGYLLRRILRAVPVLFLVTLVSFSIMSDRARRPGGRSSPALGRRSAGQVQRDPRTQLGLDRAHPRPASGRWYRGPGLQGRPRPLHPPRPVGGSRAIAERLPGDAVPGSPCALRPDRASVGITQRRVLAVAPAQGTLARPRRS